MVELKELPLAGALNLRVAVAKAQPVSDFFGVALPQPNTWIAAPKADLLWQAFDEWLILTPNRQQHALASSLRAALAGTHFAVTDVSDLRIAFALEGSHARDVLQKGCAVDLHPRVFGAGSCVTTALARVRVTIRQTSPAPRFEILVERSYAMYLREWLADASLEYSAATHV